jgi:alpha-D-ribose 1-methylphosphonate 5-triphosphate synthase subunit PhnH
MAESRTRLRLGFADPVLNSQRTFRFILHAMARPGNVQKIPVLPDTPPPLYPTTTAICLTLLDLDTPLWLDEVVSSPEVLGYIRFHCGCPFVNEPHKAGFALVGDGLRLPPLDGFAMGDPAYPERSTTVIVQVSDLLSFEGKRLTGPGIETVARLQVMGLADSFWPAFITNHSMFPLGVDVILTSPDSVCALPRSVKVEG